MKTYIITEIVKMADRMPAWLGWTVVGVLATACVAVIGFMVAEIIINR